MENALIIYLNVSTLGPRLNLEDFKTITNNVKYLALRQEAAHGGSEDPLVILTKSGVEYLQKQWGKSVNKNGKRCPPPNSDDARQQIPGRRGEAQRYDNTLFNLILPYYTAPERYDLIQSNILLVSRGTGLNLSPRRTLATIP